MTPRGDNAARSRLMIRAHKALSIKSPTPDARHRRLDRVMSASGSDVARTPDRMRAPSSVPGISNTQYLSNPASAEEQLRY
jgi:hypothetical protein